MVSLWALRRAGLAPLAATRTLLTFLVVLHSVFLASIEGQSVDARDRLYLSEDVPTMLIWGAKEPIIPLEHGRRAHELTPHSRLEVFPGASTFRSMMIPTASSRS